MFLVTLAALTTMLPGQTGDKKQARPEFMHVEEIRTGMKGHGLTIFKENKIERFDVEIIGVLPNYFAGMDLILARLSSPYLKDIGVVAGMSGSPVFIDDRMIGAVAYGWGFSKEPIAGITPIKNMLEVLEQTTDKPHPEESGEAGDFLSQWNAMREQGGYVPLKPAETITIGRDRLPGLPGLPEDGLTLEPLSTPLVISGCHPSVFNKLERHFQGTGFMPVLGGGGNLLNPGLKDDPIENGSGLSIPLMSGSMDFSAIGTVTYRKGERLVAFGHPFWQMGNVDAPMASAHIFTVVPSFYRPFKIGASVREVGSIRQDRLSAVGGHFGTQAPTFDLQVVVHKTHEGDKKETTGRTFDYRIWENAMIGPMLADIALSESIINSDKFMGNSAARIRYGITLADGSKIEKEDFMATDSILAFRITMPLYYDLYLLMNNPFQKTDVNSVDIRVDLYDKFQAVAMETAVLNKDVYRPGETVEARVYFMPYRKERFSRTFSIKLPEDLRDGIYTLGILNGEQRTQIEFRRSPGMGKVFSYEALLKFVRIAYPGNRLYLLLTQPEAGIRINENEMPALPMSVMAPTHSSTPQTFAAPVSMNFLKEESLETEYEIMGSQYLQVRVDRRGRR